MTRIEELQEERRDLHARRRDLEEQIRVADDAISAIRKAESEWKVGQRVRWDKRNWLVIDISNCGQKPLLKQFLASGKLGTRTTWPWWFGPSSDRKPEVLPEPGAVNEPQL